MPLGKERALVSPEAVESLFTKFQQTMKAIDPTTLTSPELIFNVNESGFAINTKNSQIVAYKRSQNAYSISWNTKVTVLTSCSVYIPLMLIIRG